MEDEVVVPVNRELKAKRIHRAATRRTGNHTHAMCKHPTKAKSESHDLCEHVEFEVWTLSSMIGAPSDKAACSRAMRATKCLPTSDDEVDRGEELEELVPDSAV
jgi:hypothetical protein